MTKSVVFEFADDAMLVTFVGGLAEEVAGEDEARARSCWLRDDA